MRRKILKIIADITGVLKFVFRARRSYKNCSPLEIGWCRFSRSEFVEARRELKPVPTLLSTICLLTICDNGTLGFEGGVLKL